MCHSAIGLDAIHGAGCATHGSATTSIDAYATANRTAGADCGEWLQFNLKLTVFVLF
jgi:hypothetical protein